MLNKNRQYIFLIFSTILLILIISGIFYFKQSSSPKKLQQVFTNSNANNLAKSDNINIYNITTTKPKEILNKEENLIANGTEEKLSERNSSIENFAKCLTEKGVELYVLATCPYCNLQKQMFGDSLKFLKVIECSENQELCIQKNISVVPTWILPTGEKLTGLQNFEILSQKTSCQF